jgi:circadian clock protein KaiC
VTAHRAKILVVDGFAAVSDSAQSGEELKIFVQELQTQADAADCTVFLLTNPTEQTPSSEETMVDGIINLESCLHEARSARDLHVRKLRGTRHLEGLHSYQIDDGGITVYPRLETLIPEESSDNGSTQKISSGNERLDQMLGGGLPMRSVTMMVGPSGTGKTTIGLQFLSNSTEDEPGLLFGFYESPERIRSKAKALCNSKARVFESGEVEIVWMSPNDQLLDDLGDQLIAAVRRRKVKRLMIDGLGGFNKAIRSRPIERFFSALVYQLRAEGVTTVCTAEVAEIIGPTITTPLWGLSDVTDNHILLRFREVGAALHRLISILKVRDSGFDPGLRTFSITHNGVELAESSRDAESILLNWYARERKVAIVSAGAVKTGDE